MILDEAKATVLFRSSFPKQPGQRRTRIVCYIDLNKSLTDHGRFVVHYEYLDDIGSDFFLAEGFYTNTFVQAVQEYERRHIDMMEYFQASYAWDIVNSELMKENE